VSGSGFRVPTIPSGYLLARKAAIELAKARAPDAAVEAYLALPTEAERWHAYAVRPVRRTIFDTTPTYLGLLPQPAGAWEPPQQWLRAFQALETARDETVQWWADGALPIVGLGSDGQLRELPPELGRTEAARLAMLSGTIYYLGVGWIVLISLEALARCVRGSEPPIIEAAVSAETVAPAVADAPPSPSHPQATDTARRKREWQPGDAARSLPERVAQVLYDLHQNREINVTARPGVHDMAAKVTRKLGLEERIPSSTFKRGLRLAREARSRAQVGSMSQTDPT
jgi:hypothetical protein